MGAGKEDGSGVDAPTISLLSSDRMGAFGAARRISGSGRVYGRSSILLPSFRQSSNLAHAVS